MARTRLVNQNPHTNAQRRKIRVSAQQPQDVTAEWIAYGRPTRPLADVKRAAREHFRQTRGSSGAYRAFARVVVRKRLLLPSISRIVAVQIHRNGDVEYTGVVHTGR